MRTRRKSSWSPLPPDVAPPWRPAPTPSPPPSPRVSPPPSISSWKRAVGTGKKESEKEEKQKGRKCHPEPDFFLPRRISFSPLPAPPSLGEKGEGFSLPPTHATPFTLHEKKMNDENCERRGPESASHRGKGGRRNEVAQKLFCRCRSGVTVGEKRSSLFVCPSASQLLYRESGRVFRGLVVVAGDSGKKFSQRGRNWSPKNGVFQAPLLLLPALVGAPGEREEEVMNYAAAPLTWHHANSKKTRMHASSPPTGDRARR